MSCTHLTAKDHKKGLRWVCSHCRLVFDWSDTSSYFGDLECRECGFTTIVKVFCSYTCKKEHGAPQIEKTGAVTAGTPSLWRPHGSSGMGFVAPAESLPDVPATQDAPGAANEVAVPRLESPPRTEKTTRVHLTEHELMEIMVALVEASKGKFCSPDQAARIAGLLEHKIDPAMRDLRLG